MTRVDWLTEEQHPDDKAIQERLTSTGSLPSHIAVIMDGNGRWAQGSGRPRIDGHREGMESVRAVVKATSQLGINFLTLYAFSIENWKRPATEVGFLMRLLESYLRKEVDELHANRVRIRTIGNTNALPKAVQHVLRSAMERTANNQGLTLTLALSYGARWDLMRAMQLFALDVRRGKMSPEDVNDETIRAYLQTSFLPDPDLIIRTSGEMRLSNFLLWEAAYSELYVTDIPWPEFRRAELYAALCTYLERERRFGKTSAQVQNGDSSSDHISTLRQILNAFS